MESSREKSFELESESKRLITDSYVRPGLRAIPMTSRVMAKNVLVLSMGFVFLFTAFDAIVNLQTSLNKEDGVGAWSVMAIYTGMMVSSMFMPK